MKHLRRSLLLAIATLAVTAGATYGAPVPADAVRAAIVRSVAERIGGHAIVTVGAVRTAVASDLPLSASPEPGARTGGGVRFVLFAGGVRIGTAVATVHVTATHLRARRAMARDETIAAADIEEVEAPLRKQPMRRLPALSDIVGARLRRNVAAGEPMTADAVAIRPLVTSGDSVVVLVRVGAVVAEGRAIASGSGHLGDVVRIIRPGTRRPIKARITGPGKVEILR